MIKTKILELYIQYGQQLNDPSAQLSKAIIGASEFMVILYFSIREEFSEVQLYVVAIASCVFP